MNKISDCPGQFVRHHSTYICGSHVTKMVPNVYIRDSCTVSDEIEETVPSLHVIRTEWTVGRQEVNRNRQPHRGRCVRCLPSHRDLVYHQ